MVFNQARAIVRKFAFVHIASAKFELESLGKLKLHKIAKFPARPYTNQTVQPHKMARSLKFCI